MEKAIILSVIWLAWGWSVRYLGMFSIFTAIILAGLTGQIIK